MVQETKQLIYGLEEANYVAAANRFREALDSSIEAGEIPSRLPPPVETFHHSAFDYDHSRRLLRTAEIEIRLTFLEAKIFEELIDKVNRVVTHPQLVKQVWGWGEDVREPGSPAGLVKSHIRNIRKKLKQSNIDPALIRTLSGSGYSLEEKSNDCKPDPVQKPSQLREISQEPEKICQHSAFTYYPERSAVEINGSFIHLTLKENQILDLLFRYANRIVDFERLIVKLWSYESDVKDEKAILKCHTSHLRKKIDPNKTGILEGVSGMGYRLNDPGKGNQRIEID